MGGQGVDTPSAERMLWGDGDDLAGLTAAAGGQVKGAVLRRGSG